MATHTHTNKQTVTHTHTHTAGAVVNYGVIAVAVFGPAWTSIGRQP